MMISIAITGIVLGCFIATSKNGFEAWMIALLTFILCALMERA